MIYKWNIHIEKICASANKRLDVLTHLKYKLDRKSLEIMYNSYIRPLLEYACVVWDNCTEVLSDKLERVQKRAARIVSGAIIRTPTELIYEELGWSSLKERRKNQRVKMMHKIIKTGNPSYLHNTIPLPVNERTNYNLRNRNDLTVQLSRTDRFLNSFILKTVNDYNSLDPNLRELSPLEFNKALKSSRDPVCPWFYSGDRKLSIIHARLRMKCSSLNSDLYGLNIIETKKCSCGCANENSQHYFLSCPLYYRQRILLRNELLNMNFTFTLNCILFGDKKLSNDDNIAASILIHDFIKESLRF